MNPLNQALADATERLKPTSDTARLDAELLMAHALDIERDVLLLAPPGGSAPAHFRDLVERRAEGEPVAYITGRRAFWNIELAVGPGALIPRPDSETLIAAAIGHFAGSDGLDDYRRLAPAIGRLIAPGGLAAIEIGHDQAVSAAQLFEAAGHQVRLSHDLAGRPRALLI